MATDGPTPPPCDQEIYLNGSHVFTIVNVPSNRLEDWVRRLAVESGQRVDWHFMGGRGIVKAIGDVGSVERAAEKLGAP